MNTVRCPQCNLTNWSTATNCKRCGFAFQQTNFNSPQNPAPQFQQPFQTQNYAPRQTWTPPAQSQSGYQRNYNSNRQNEPLKRKLAIFSMILGILNFPLLNMFIASFFIMILALILGTAGMIIGVIIWVCMFPTGLVSGIVALVRANKRPDVYGGKGFAIAGVVLNVVSLLVIPIIAAIAIPNLLAARRSANEGSAISAMKTLANAESDFYNSSRKCGDLTELGNAKMIDEVLASGKKNGYLFEITPTAQGCAITAKPLVTQGATSTGTRTFYYVLEEGKLHVANVNEPIASSSSKTLDEVQGFPPPLRLPQNNNGKVQVSTNQPSQ